MVRAVRPLRSLSMARGCARIDSRPDTAKIGSAGRVEVHHARLLAVMGKFPHGLDPERKCFSRGRYRRRKRRGRMPCYIDATFMISNVPRKIISTAT